MSTEVAEIRPQRREITQVVDAVPILDSARFEHMQRIANVLARSSMIPETLRTVGTKDNKTDLPFEQVLSNCFLVVNQAARWGMDPFAVISCCSVVHGRLAYEGKLVAAVLEAKLGVHLTYKWDDKPNDFAGIVVSGTLPDGRTETVEGTVGQWKTTGPGSPWAKQPKLQLAYRGAREWARLYAPGVMLGVYGEDEMENLVEDARARRAVTVTSLAERLAAAKTPDTAPADGFSQQHVTRELGGMATGGDNQDKTPHNATLHEQDLSSASATDAHSHPDRDETAGEVTNGGGHEVTAAAEAPDQTSSATDSNSSQPGVPHADAETDTPASETSPPEPTDAGNLSEAADPLGSDAGTPALPQGWEIRLSDELHRAPDEKSLVSYAKKCFEKLGAVPTTTQDIEIAKAIRAAFKANFGNRQAIEDAIRELV